MKKLNKGLAAALSLGVLLMGAPVQAATTINLGSAASFGVLAGSAITNTGSSVINGNLGLTPGTAVTGFPPGTVTGSQSVANTVAIAAQNDLITAYNNAIGQAADSSIGTELGGTIKTPGVYSSGSFGITGALTLDAGGNPNAVFIFKADSTLITAGASSIVLTGGAQACNVFWQVGSSATLGANSTFKGNILALTSATLTTGASVEGRVLARNGAVTLDSNTIVLATCAPAPVPVVVTPAPTSTPTPTPAPIQAPTSTISPAPVVVTPTPTPTPTSTPIAAAIIPGLPMAGFAPDGSNIAIIIISMMIVGCSALLYMSRRERTGEKA